MLNQIVLVGRLVNNPEISETESGKATSKITLAVPRSYKNENGEYETDFINCRIWGNMAKNTSEYCRKGDLIGIKGRVETYNRETKEGKKYYTEIVADKITFLSNSKKREEEKEQEEPTLA